MGVVKKYGLARTDTQANTPMNEEWKKKKKKKGRMVPWLFELQLTWHIPQHTILSLIFQLPLDKNKKKAKKQKKK